jgi:voltage-gated potassium channel Kch
MFTTLVILSFIIKSDRVTEDTLYGAVSVYILIALSWAAIYGAIEAGHPGSFFVDQSHNPDGVLAFADFVYYSVVTLTTLGYGEMAPVTDQARSMAIIESMIGVMYTAILISRLVSLYILQYAKQ